MDRKELIEAVVDEQVDRNLVPYLQNVKKVGFRNLSRYQR